MSKVTYIEANGAEHVVDVEIGSSLMRLHCYVGVHGAHRESGMPR